jgi:hypothetical protein
MRRCYETETKTVGARLAGDASRTTRVAGALLREWLASLRFISRNKAPAPSDPIDIGPRSEHEKKPVVRCLFSRRAERSDAGRQSKWSPIRRGMDAEEI